MQSPEKKDVSLLFCRVQIGNQWVSIASPVARPLLESSEGSKGRYINEKGGGQTITKSWKCFKEKSVIRKIFSYIP